MNCETCEIIYCKYYTSFCFYIVLDFTLKDNIDLLRM